MADNCGMTKRDWLLLAACVAGVAAYIAQASTVDAFAVALFAAPLGSLLYAAVTYIRVGLRRLPRRADMHALPQRLRQPLSLR